MPTAHTLKACGLEDRDTAMEKRLVLTVKYKQDSGRIIFSNKNERYIKYIRKIYKTNDYNWH